MCCSAWVIRTAPCSSMRLQVKLYKFTQKPQDEEEKKEEFSYCSIVYIQAYCNSWIMQLLSRSTLATSVTPAFVISLQDKLKKTFWSKREHNCVGKIKIGTLKKKKERKKNGIAVEKSYSWLDQIILINYDKSLMQEFLINASLNAETPSSLISVLSRLKCQHNSWYHFLNCNLYL